jgi:hypothetical protein
MHSAFGPPLAGRSRDIFEAPHILCDDGNIWHMHENAPPHVTGGFEQPRLSEGWPVGKAERLPPLLRPGDVHQTRPQLLSATHSRCSNCDPRSKGEP